MNRIRKFGSKRRVLLKYIIRNKICLEHNISHVTNVFTEYLLNRYGLKLTCERWPGFYFKVEDAKKFTLFVMSYSDYIIKI